MPLWTLFVWLIVGAIAAFVTRKSIAGNPPFGAIGDLIIGAAGGVIGGYVLAMFVAATNLGLILSVIAACVVAVVLIMLSGKVKKPAGEL